MNNWQEYLAAHVPKLTGAGVRYPEQDLKIIISLVSNVPLDAVSWEDKPSPALLEKIEPIVQRRLQREPLERIFGYSLFNGLKLEMRPEVFRPCEETLTTVDHALLHLREKKGPLRILDLGTGSGCILLALLSQLPQATGVGIDRDGEAIALAQRNAGTCGLADRALFQTGDWTDGLSGAFDLIISNPPRIPTAMVPHLVREVAWYDPPETVDAGRDGVAFYGRTARDFRRLAAADGVCIMQVGKMMAGGAQRAFIRHGFRNVKILRDYKAEANCLLVENEPLNLSFLTQIGRLARYVVTYPLLRLKRAL